MSKSVNSIPVVTSVAVPDCLLRPPVFFGQFQLTSSKDLITNLTNSLQKFLIHVRWSLSRTDGSKTLVVIMFVVVLVVFIIVIVVS